MPYPSPNAVDLPLRDVFAPKPKGPGFRVPFFIAFLKAKRRVGADGPAELVFGDLGERIERAMQNYINSPPPIVPRGRPGDLWLVQLVALLAMQLMVGPSSGRWTRPRGWVKQSEKKTIGAIERLLKLTDHRDIVTGEKIRHIIRQLRPSLKSLSEESTPTTMSPRSAKSRSGSGLKR